VESSRSTRASASEDGRGLSQGSPRGLGSLFPRASAGSVSAHPLAAPATITLDLRATVAVAPVHSSAEAATPPATAEVSMI